MFYHSKNILSTTNSHTEINRCTAAGIQHEGRQTLTFMPLMRWYIKINMECSFECVSAAVTCSAHPPKTHVMSKSETSIKLNNAYKINPNSTFKYQFWLTTQHKNTLPQQQWTNHCFTNGFVSNLTAVIDRYHRITQSHISLTPKVLYVYQCYAIWA